ncbi:unnamed protein product [Cercospora beticola]|nr:unnamed protein product [Cercospora beticola]
MTLFSWLISALWSRSVIAQASVPLSWAPKDFPITGQKTNAPALNHYNATSTLAYQSDDVTAVNCHSTWFFITTMDNKKHHLSNIICLEGRDLLRVYSVYSDLSNTSVPFQATVRAEPVTAREDRLSITSHTQKISVETAAEQHTFMNWVTEYDGVRVDAQLMPAGSNFYLAGSGGVQLPPSPTQVDPFAGFPGFSWYWTNPNLRINGTFTVNGVTSPIDSTQSFAHYGRQYGYFALPSVYWAVWLRFPTGEMLMSWNIFPDSNGHRSSAWASIWHPNGLVEYLPVGGKTSASDVSTSASGRQYWNSFVLDLPAINSSLEIQQWTRNAEFVADGSPLNLTESYAEGSGVWRGKWTTFVAHVEQAGAKTER